MYRNLRKVFKTHAAEVISCSSVLIALSTLWFTIEAQKVDRYYKELSIVPKLTLMMSTEDLGMVILNAGLGPATIKRVATNVHGSCFDSKKISAKEWSEISARELKKWAEWSIAGLVSELPLQSQVYYRVANISPDTSFAIGERVSLISLTNAEEITKALRLKVAKDFEANERFNSRVVSMHRELPIAVEYCSVSGQTCLTPKRSRSFAIRSEWVLLLSAVVRSFFNT